MKRSTLRHKYASETEGVLQNSDQASNGKWGERYVAYNDETRKLIGVNEMKMLRWMHVHANTIEKERTHTRDNERCTGFRKDHGETIELVWSCRWER